MRSGTFGQARREPGFKAWNKIADTYQVGSALAFGGETVLQLDD